MVKDIGAHIFLVGVCVRTNERSLTKSHIFFDSEIPLLRNVPIEIPQECTETYVQGQTVWKQSLLPKGVGFVSCTVEHYAVIKKEVNHIYSCGKI